MSVSVTDVTDDSATIIVFLSEAWNTNNYQQIVFSYDQVPVNGGTTPPSQIVGYTFPPSDTNTGTTATGYAGSLQPSTVYTFWATTQAVNGKYYDAGSVTFMTEDASGPLRPNNFQWSYSKDSGDDFNLTDGEWNSFCSRINEFRQYKSLGTYYFTNAYYGDDFTASMFNETVYAISDMSPLISPPGTKDSGQDILADYMNRLRDSLNSIP